VTSLKTAVKEASGEFNLMLICLNKVIFLPPLTQHTMIIKSFLSLLRKTTGRASIVNGKMMVMP